MIKNLNGLDLDAREKHKEAKIINDTELSKKNKELILRYLRESRLGKTIKKGQKKIIGPGRNLQAMGMLNLMCKDWFKKDLDKVTDKDMETFILKLDQGKILSKLNKPYGQETKSNIKKFIRKFYKWFYGDGYNYPGLVD